MYEIVKGWINDGKNIIPKDFDMKVVHGFLVNLKEWELLEK
jgi:hypothetical protein